MAHRRWTLGLLLLAAVACGPEATPRTAENTNGPAEPTRQQLDPGAPPFHPEEQPGVPPQSRPPQAPPPQTPGESSRASAASDCAVELHLEIQELDRQRVLRVFAKNLTRQRLEFSIPERCPNGPVDFEGLPAGYDYYGTCASGACQGWPALRQIALPPGALQPLAEARVFIDGRAPCTTALPPGRYHVRPVAPRTDVAMCVNEAALVIPEPPSERELTEARKDPYFCLDSSECVLSCPEPSGCCGHPCGCRHAINARHRAAYEANYARTCSRPPCPAVGCAYEPAAFAVCRNHRCQAGSGLGAF
jgi:hypothetical protein